MQKVVTDHFKLNNAFNYRGRPSNSKLSEDIRSQCLTIVADQLHGFGPTLAHEKLTTTTVHKFDISVETLRSWMIAADLWIPILRNSDAF